MPTAFERLHPAVQRRLYDAGWTALRPIQDRAIEHLLSGRGDCIVSAPTAGGKTEAAFLPILSSIAEDSAGGVRAMYIGPLKALINDQFRRVEGLCERMEMPVHKWHGDVGDAQRRALLTNPSGVLLITPESLEAMFVIRPTKMPAIFDRLAYVVIDELHAFIGSVRGAQLLSQLHRLRERCGCDPVRVGLSATLGDPAAACAWLRPGGPPASYIEDAEAERRVAVKVRGLWRKAPEKLPEAEETSDAMELEASDPVLGELARSLLRACGSSTNLVFANAKSQIEAVADELQEQANAMGVRHDVVVHHGSLSKEQREAAEDRLRADLPCSAVCSNTLEMGIDIGEVDNVVQVSAPWSVSSLTQRLGRSGRREGAAAVLRGFFIENEPDPRSTFWDGLHLGFLRGIAMIELMLEKFSEPPETTRHHYSTMVHQLLSVLSETKGLPAATLFRRLTASGAFGALSTGEFAGLVRALAAVELVAQAPGGDLILGTRGERITEHYSFYAAFATPEEFRVLFGMQEIGRLLATALPLPGEPVILGGRRWTVEDIDSGRREVHVVSSRSRRVPLFRTGAFDVHPRVHARMRDLLASDVVPTYLDETARDILSQARENAARANNFRPALQSVSAASARVFVWAGSRIQRTLFLALREAGVPVTEFEVGLDVGASVEVVYEHVRSFARGLDGERLARRAAKELGARAAGDKFDEFVPEALWCRAYASERLCISEAMSWCSSVSAGAAS